MPISSAQLHDQLQNAFGDTLLNSKVAFGEVTVSIDKSDLLAVCQQLRDEFGFEQLMDLCGIDYLTYGKAEWDTDVSGSGFSRGVSDIFDFDQPDSQTTDADEQRFGVVYHLQSIQHNQRLRLHTAASDNPPRVSSVVTIWNAANWYEREAFDLYGILFEGHPDLRRLLTDYGFIGHPFRKDFPLIGEVEMRYDPEQQRVIYQPVSIEPRTLVPRVIRDDNRYAETDAATN